MRRIALLASLAGLIAAAPASAANIQTNIIGGNDAAQGQFPFMAFVSQQLSADEYDLCSGTVIADNVVLTAAHCAQGAAANYRVVTNSVDWTHASQRQVSVVSKVIVDPNYNPTTHDGDAALLVLSLPTTAPSVAVITAGTLKPGTRAEIAGWGKASSTSDTVQDVLHYAPTVIQSPVLCGISPVYDSARQLCALDYPDDQTSTCNGDSGGPLLITYRQQWVEVGITSYGSSTCATSLPQFFTAVEPLSSWLEREVAALTRAAMAPSTRQPSSLPASKARQAMPRLLSSLATSGPYAVRPRTISLSANGSGFVAGPHENGKINWTSWTQTQATGTGDEWLDNCRPDCATGRYSAYPVKLHAYRPRDGRFTRLTITRRYDGKWSARTYKLVEHAGNWFWQ